jgi:type I restriction enzyme S subunit
LNPKANHADDLEVGFVPMPLMGTRFGELVRYETRPWGDVRKGYTHFQNGDVLLAKITPCFENGKGGLISGLPNGIGAGSTEYFVCRPQDSCLSPEYLLGYLKTPEFMSVGATQMTGSVGHKRVPKDFLMDSHIPLAPLAEQKRIAEKLEAVLGRVDACRTRLDRVPALLKRFRQSVLAAATSGQLTEDWREANQHVENAQLKLDISLADVAAEYAISTKEAKRHGKKKPARPTCLDNYELAWEDDADLPDTWSVLPIGKVCLKVTDGTHGTPKTVPTGIRYITAKHIRERRIDFVNSLFLSAADHDEIFARCNPQLHDVLIVNIGAGTATPALVRVDYEFSLKNVALLKPNKEVLMGEYLEFYLLSTKPRVFNQVTRGGSQPFMGLDLIKTIPCHLPPLPEQAEIVRRVEVLFAMADRIEARLSSAQKTVDRLTPAVLAKAFRGQLVPQDPTDEPAEALLARLAAQNQPTSRSAKKSKK